MTHQDYCETCSGIGSFRCPVCDGAGVIDVADGPNDDVPETSEQMRKRELKMLAAWKAMAEDLLHQYPAREVP
jgi:DnaJ-class molecular chaperone